MMYLGAQNQIYSANMFDVQARWAVKNMAGHIQMPPLEKCLEENKEERER